MRKLLWVIQREFYMQVGGLATRPLSVHLLHQEDLDQMTGCPEASFGGLEQREK